MGGVICDGGDIEGGGGGHPDPFAVQKDWRGEDDATSKWEREETLSFDHIV